MVQCSMVEIKLHLNPLASFSRRLIWDSLSIKIKYSKFTVSTQKTICQQVSFSLLKPSPWASSKMYTLQSLMIMTVLVKLILFIVQMIWKSWISIIWNNRNWKDKWDLISLDSPKRPMALVKMLWHLQIHNRWLQEIMQTYSKQEMVRISLFWNQKISVHLPNSILVKSQK